MRESIIEPEASRAIGQAAKDIPDEDRRGRAVAVLETADSDQFRFMGPEGDEFHFQLAGVDVYVPLSVVRMLAPDPDSSSPTYN